MRVDFYFDVVCPYAYLAHTQIEGVCSRAGAELVWKPILLGGLFRTIGAGAGPMPNMPPSKAAMNLRDMFRWAEHWGVPLVMPAGHPLRTVTAMRAVLASNDQPHAAKALFNAYWRDGRDVSNDTVVANALDAAGFDGAALLERTAAFKDELRIRTDEAAAAGAFGVPTFVVHAEGREPELFWGQDRLLFVEKALAE
jgi:2-hydroxychromene-2-carboxylate isomerase